MLTVLLIIMIVALLGTIALTVTSTDVGISGNYRASRQAFYAAEAGAHSVIAAYFTMPLHLSSKLPAAAMGFATSRPDSANYTQDKAFWIPSLVYDSATPPAWVKIESHGTVIGTNSDASVILYVAAVYSPFSMGVFGNNRVALTGQGYFDSFDSRVAPWSEATRVPDGNIGTNSTSSGAVSVGTSSVIYGNVVIGPGGDPATVVSANPSSITGTITAASNLKDLTPIVDPGVGTNITITGSSSGQNISTGIYRAPEIKLGGSNRLNIIGDVTLYVTGDVSLTSQAYISIPQGSSLKLIISGSMTINSSGTTNESLKAQNLLIYGTQSSTSISLGGSASLYAAIYAPNADLSYSGSAGMFGSLVGKSVTVSGRGALHYDKALDVITSTGGALTNFRVLSWKDGHF